MAVRSGRPNLRFESHAISGFITYTGLLLHMVPALSAGLRLLGNQITRCAGLRMDHDSGGCKKPTAVCGTGGRRLKYRLRLGPDGTGLESLQRAAIAKSYEHDGPFSTDSTAAFALPPHSLLTARICIIEQGTGIEAAAPSTRGDEDASPSANNKLYFAARALVMLRVHCAVRRLCIEFLMANLTFGTVVAAHSFPRGHFYAADRAAHRALRSSARSMSTQIERR
ncbi:hypothetical protein OBBRIDRAFT_824238 [Obba rivulosa]|uniref:Uncharacterized protein n=1 Tax=Obba rivulosa TaxID=1052685 RepID=A0A8E2DPC8_9APHY|nr:hypothetical protein OBBRIDRAFT_824238 [Obba rivulosa]